MTRRLSYRAWMFYAAVAVVGGYSCAHAQTTRGTDDQTAFGVPRVAMNGAPGVGLPQPLPPGEAARIRRIFGLQAAGSIAEAARETNQLDDNLLLGPILAARYLSGWAHPTTAELSGWLAAYGDQPDAPAIRALRARLAPDATPAIDIPVPHRRGPAVSPSAAGELFTQNRDTEAVAAAAPLLARPSARMVEPLFSAGLAAWRLGNMPVALRFLDTAYRVAPNPEQHAAAAFWAARAAQRQADRSTSVVWLRRAAQHSGTFYGRIAARALGPALGCLAGGALLGTADIDALVATPQGSRAFALLQVGQKARAEAELRALWGDSGQNAALARPLALLARAIGMPGFAAELHYATLPGPTPPDPPSLHPAGGFVVDPSLIYALVHHESNFHTAAVSLAGARGLMQIKPMTARAVSGGAVAARLHDPAVNLAVGQQYLLQLSQDDTIDGDLIRLLAAYAQGLSGEKRWVDSVNGGGDPLLFIEAIPNPATRHFVQDVLVWSWRYAATFQLPPASLDALAAGQFPRLVRADAETDVAGGCMMTAGPP
jgi:soluble lytic murein transglycosylase-like protein